MGGIKKILMKISSAEYIISAVNKKQYPKDRKPEVAFVGRSNVGKSSLINKLVNRKNLARTSSKPGKTRTINFYDINNDLRFVDLPGYGFASVSKDTREKWSYMINEYFDTSKNLYVVLQLVDLRHEPTLLDKMMYEWLLHYDIPKIIIATKADKVSRGHHKKHLDNIKKALKINEGDHLRAFSAKSGDGKSELWGLIQQYIGTF